MSGTGPAVRAAPANSRSPKRRSTIPADCRRGNEPSTLAASAQREWFDREGSVRRGVRLSRDQ